LDFGFNQVFGVEAKKTHDLSTSLLEHQRDTTIEVELVFGEVVRSAIGQGQLDSDPELGNIVRIRVADSAGDFELLIPESDWKGSFQPSFRADCKLKISLWFDD